MAGYNSAELGFKVGGAGARSPD